MILLISGASHAGKTALAQRLLEKHHIPYLSIDHLKMGLIRTRLSPYTVEEDRSMTGFLWPIVREMIKTAIENDQHMIVEGLYIPFDWKESFEPEYLLDIQAICLCLSDDYIDNHFKDIQAHANTIETRLDNSYLTPELLKKENHYYLEGTKQHANRYILIEGDYEAAIDELLKTFPS